MQTRCPECHRPLTIDADQLQHGQRQIQCGECGTSFDALAALSDDAEEPPAEELTPPPFMPLLSPEPEAAETPPAKTRPPRAPYPWEEGAGGGIQRTGLWGTGIAGLVLLLGIQIVLFEGHRLAQSTRVRPLLAAVCAHLPCTLPPYRDLAAIEVVDRSLSPLADGGLEFRALIVNNAPFAQALPALKLTLLAVDGSAYAQRVFEPTEYLSDQPLPEELPAGRPFEATLRVADPTAEVAGYAFEFI